MASMTHRTTFSLDPQTVGRLRILSKRWNVSQAEVVRRALEAAEKLETPDPLLALRDYHHAGGLSQRQANAYVDEWSEDRDNWGKE